MRELHPDTLAVRAGIERSQFGEHSEALYLTSSFVYGSAAEAAERFAADGDGNVYTRFSNPTVTAFQKRLAAMEGAERCVASATGMSAILSVAMGLLKAGDHVVASRGLFGSTMQMFAALLPKFGIETSFVPADDIDAYRAAVKPNTRMFVVETPSNPLTQLVDIAAVAGIAHDAGALLVVDNSFCTCALQRPLELGADIVVYSATKYLEGQGRVLGGAALGSHALMDDVYKFLRTAGPALSPFNAWVILAGLETLRIRMDAQSAIALELARWLETQPGVAHVLYPGLPSHPQYELACRQQKSGGAVIGVDLKGGKSAAWKVIDATRLISITGNLGDTKTTITHPATTTHGRLTQEARDAAGVGDGLLRLAIGLESIDDLKADLKRGLALL